MAERDEAYYQRRAQVEADLARQAVAPIVALAHRRLADAYRDRLAELPSGEAHQS